MSGSNRLPGLRVDDGYTVHPFDEAYGVRTSGLIAGRHLGSGHRHDRGITAYFGVAPSVFRRLIARWRREGRRAPVSEYTFIDAGAGMGRAMLLAAETGFREIAGVELNPALTRIARKNLQRWRCDGRLRGEQRMRLIQGCAAEMELPAGPLLLFLFNPFDARVMNQFLQSVERQRARETAPAELLYVNCEQEAVIEGRHLWKRFFSGRIARSKADAAADHRIMAAQPDGEYASGNYEECSGWRLN
jgi:SAM-dependent methyltransferase